MGPMAQQMVPFSVTGQVVETDPDEFPQAIVESLTEWDYVDLPDDLRAELREWCARFKLWAAERCATEHADHRGIP